MSIGNGTRSVKAGAYITSMGCCACPQVAIKQLKGGSALSEREMALLSREVAIMRALPPHERIARMLGSVEVPGEGICLVMSYYPYTLQVSGVGSCQAVHPGSRVAHRPLRAFFNSPFAMPHITSLSWSPVPCL